MVEEHTHTESSGSGMGMGMIIGILVVILVLVFLFMYGFNTFNGSAQNGVTIPDQIDVNVNPETNEGQ